MSPSEAAPSGALSFAAFPFNASPFAAGAFAAASSGRLGAGTLAALDPAPEAGAGISADPDPEAGAGAIRRRGTVRGQGCGRVRRPCTSGGSVISGVAWVRLFHTVGVVGDIVVCGHAVASIATRSAARPREPYAFTEPSDIPSVSATWASVMSAK